MRTKVRIAALILGCGLLTTGSAHADRLYKWTDADGNVHYSQHEPTPAEAKTQERKRFGDQPADVGLPYALQRAVKNYPVTLYTSDCGEGCSKAAALLAQRGVPFSEKNARDAAAGKELMALTGGKLEVPVLKIGSQILRGWEETAWNQALDAAGYPRTAVISPKVATKAPAAKPDAPTPAAANSEPGKYEKPAAPSGANAGR